MFCNFCGKNFDATEGFEENSRSGHHYVRCEKCVQSHNEEEYDWHRDMYGRATTQHRSGQSKRPLRSR
jgi:hypothetical protein